MVERMRAKLARKNEAPEPDLDLRRCKWDQVMQEVHSTANRWKSSSGKMSKTMDYIDKLRRNSEAFSDWLELLPAGDYGSRLVYTFLSKRAVLMLSSICGAFKIVIQVRQRELSATAFRYPRLKYHG